MFTTMLAIGLTLAFPRLPGSADPKDPCTLLTSAQIQTLGPAATGAGVSSSLGEMGMNCRYTWGSGKAKYTLDVQVSEVAKLWPGTDMATVRSGLLMQAKVSKTVDVVPFGGNAAIIDSKTPILNAATAIVKTWVLSITLEGPDARSRKAQVIALLKAAAGKL